MNDHGNQDPAPAAREDCSVSTASSFRVEVGDERLNFRPVSLSDPVPLGRQILSAAGLDPRDGYSLFAILASGEFEDLRLDEPFDLRGRGAERFIAFRTDREFKLTLNDNELQWGKAVISGAVLHKLAKAGADDAVFLEVRGGEDRLIKPNELVDLTAPGIERFFTSPKTLSYEIIVNSRPKIIDHKKVSYEEVVELAFPGPHGENIEFSMTFRKAASMPHAGELGAGGTVEVKKKGTTFNVTRTDKS